MSIEEIVALDCSSITEGNSKIEGMQNDIVDDPSYEYKGGDTKLHPLSF